MDAYLLDWLNLLLRWAHVITAIAWIGSSFYFVSLDASLTPPRDPADAAKGVGGEQWGVHGGGFYRHQKYPVSPGYVPEPLHWSMWQSYSTWLTGFALFTLLYLVNAGTYLVDKRLVDWSPFAAGSAALGFLLVFWWVYDTLCRLAGRGPHGDAIVGAGVVLVVAFAAWLACHLFAGRAAFLLVGAMLATAMSANVFFCIIPGQRQVIAAIRAGRPVDPLHGRRGKQRSLHNTFFTLPVLFAMLSNHHGVVTGAPHNWLVLLGMMAGGALIRLSFALRHRALAAGEPVPWRWAVLGCGVLAAVVVALMPARQPVAEAAGAEAAPVRFDAVQAVIAQRCTPCHGAALQSNNLRFDSPDQIARHAAQIYQQAVVQKTMPMNNATNITDAERALIGRWFTQGATTR